MIATIGEAHDLGWRISVACALGKRPAMKSIRECVASVELDLATLVWTRGRDFPLDMLATRMRCIRCGSGGSECFFLDRKTGAPRAHRQVKPMARHTGGVRRWAIVQHWPHLVEVPAEVSAGQNYDVLHKFLATLPTAAPQLATSTVVKDDRYHLRFAFGDPTDAEAFQRRFGGVRLTAGLRSGRYLYDYLPEKGD